MQSAIDLTPPEAKLLTLSDRADAAAKDPKQIQDAIELRQHCLALAQLACRDDALQLARASSELAAVYLKAGSAAAAARHAGNAESLLTHAGAPAHADGILAQAALTLACALAAQRGEYARAQECFPRALSLCERAHGPRSVELCPLLRSFGRMLAAQAHAQPKGGGDLYARAELLLSREREIRVEHAEQAARGYRLDDLSSAGAEPDPSMWSAEAREELVGLDEERAVLLLKHAKLLDDKAGIKGGEAGVAGRGALAMRPAGPRNYGVGKDGKEMWAQGPGFVQRPPQRTTENAQQQQQQFPTASMAPPTAKPLTKRQQLMQKPVVGAAAGGGAGAVGRYLGGGGGAVRLPGRGGSGGAVDAALVAAVTGTGSSGGAADGGGSAELSALATLKRREAAELLRSTGGAASGGGGDAGAAAATVAEAQLAVQLAGACKELGEWEAAEGAYLKALPALEAAKGCSDQSVVDLWGEVLSLRMKTQRYDEAAADGQHILEMLALTRGPASVELIPAAERLAKAHVLARRWAEARDALSTAYQISMQRHGPEHRDTLRIADVLKSLERYAKPRQVAA